MTVATNASPHRPWPRPAGPWLGGMSWCDLAFLHWPVRPSLLDHRVPDPLILDRFEGEAWLSIVPFRMERVRLRGLPPFPGGAGAFPELNVRTYVRAPDGRSGVWFVSLDATSRLAVRAARLLFGLPYFDASMALIGDDGDLLPLAARRARPGAPESAIPVRYRSARTHVGAPPATLAARYAPAGAPFEAVPGTLEHWLSERYALFAWHGGRVRATEVDHPPWRLQPAEVALVVNTMADPLGLPLAAEPALAHVVRRQDVVAWVPSAI